MTCHSIMKFSDPKDFDKILAPSEKVLPLNHKTPDYRGVSYLMERIGMMMRMKTTNIFTRILTNITEMILLSLVLNITIKK